MRISDWSSDVCSSDLADAASIRFEFRAIHALAGDALAFGFVGHGRTFRSSTNLFRSCPAEPRHAWLGRSSLDFARNGWGVAYAATLSSRFSRTFALRYLCKIGSASCRE